MYLYSPFVWLSKVILKNPSTTSLTSRHPLDSVSNRRSHVCSRWKLHSKIVEAKQCEFNNTKMFAAHFFTYLPVIFC